VSMMGTKLNTMKIAVDLLLGSFMLTPPKGSLTGS
jgi:hypothetical protein